MKRRRRNWYLYSDHTGIRDQLQPLTWDEYRAWTRHHHERSGDGNWMTVHDDDGQTLAVLIRYDLRPADGVV